ncbi:MAG: hypothetical protein HY897_24140 [Deltaproteobacteria bacterium]|nr:hypothetical protein [Deltaproteobacteria bacterium]
MKTARKTRTERQRCEIGQTELRFLASHLGGQSQVASLLDVNRSSVTRWIEKEPQANQLVRISGLTFIVQRLLEVFTTDVALAWLNGVNAHLQNQKPIDLIRNGRYAEVLAAIEQDDTLAYA